MKRQVRLSDLSPEAQKQARAQLQDSTSLSNAYLQQGIGDEAKRKNETKEADSHPYIRGLAKIRIHSKRKRLTDADAIIGKWVIDALVNAGIIHDDNPSHISEVSYTQEKVAPDNEETIITITERR